VHATAVAELDWSALTAEENSFRENFGGNVCRFENNFLPFS